MVISNLKIGTSYFFTLLKEFAKENIRYPLLIIDEWLLLKPSEDEQKTIFEILHRRSGKVSTIFCSQYPSSEWYDQLGGTANPQTDSILDRIIHNAYTIDIRGSDPSKDISMHEFYGLDKKLSR